MELRWGESIPSLERFQIAAGLKDDDANVIVPVVGAPFGGSGGVSSLGEWPLNQCRMFEATLDGGYGELVVS